MIRPATLLIPLLIAALAASPSPAQNQPAQNQPAQTTYRYWTTHWSLEDIAVGDLANKLRAIGLGLPIKVDGLATVEFDVSVPLNALRTGKAYRIEGSLTIRDLVADQIRFDLFHAEVTYADGRLNLDALRCIEQLDDSGQAAPGGGRLTGSASAELLPRGEFNAEVKTANLRIGPIGKLLSRFGFVDARGVVQGAVTATVSVAGQVDQLSQPELLTIQGDLAATGLRRTPAIGFNLAAKQFSWKERELHLPELRIESTDLPDFFVNADARVRLAESTAFNANLAANDVPLDQLLGLVLADADSVVRGKLDAKGSVVGEIGPQTTVKTLDVNLSVASPSVAIGGVQLGLLEHDIRLTQNHISLAARTANQGQPESAPPPELILQSLDADFETTAQAARFSNLDGRLFGGTVSGAGQLARDPSLEHQLDVRWQDINPEFTLPFAAFAPTAQLALQTSGDVQWSVPADKLIQPSEHRGQLSIQLHALKVGQETVGRADVQVRVEPESLELSVDGTLLGGTILIQSDAGLETTTRWDQIPGKLRFREFQFQRLSLRRLLNLATVNRPRFDGRVGLVVTPIAGLPTTPATDGPNATLAIRLDGLTADGVLVARTLRIDAELSGQTPIIRSLRGTYAGGQLEAEGRWTLGNGEKLLTARLSRADGSRILLPIDEQADQWVGGRVTGRATLTGRGDGLVDFLRISGSLRVEKGTTFGMPVGDATSPMDVTVDFTPLTWKARFPAIRSTLAGGRVSGHLAFRSPGANVNGVHMDSNWRINHVDFESLLDTYLGSSTIGRGDLTGDFRLEGRNIKDARDLEGQFRVRLGGTDATAVPGLSSAGSLLGATSLVGVRFEQGEAVGRIRKGNLLLESVAMTSDRVQVTASGKVGLLSRRLDIDTVISTGNFQGQNFLLQRLGTETLTEIVPIGTVNRILSDRTIVIQMVGPARDPVIRLMTGETLRANASRFARQQALGLIIADSLLID
ncbi:AsmA-like C-terminal region-containing protein [Rhodopirellula sp. JC639]|uniref:AsmA-like C-terminal region-containing protein n=1 Tax=Stieleria mannarensis TaxID=2755585 RepID=UPI001602F311|nr:AsmA-like C-terminal region-containing protein [Rhodopirellula sp. JC639]